MSSYSKITLNGDWFMRKCNTATWSYAHVPGSVFTDLIRNEHISDPFYRDNEEEALEIAAHAYEYQREFNVSSELLQHDVVEFVCHGLDTLAEISINGKLLTRTDNMHRTYRLNVKPLLHEGSNELHIRFDSALNDIRRKHAL